jgi:GNAT superfamily N-acetyltransferase
VATVTTSFGLEYGLRGELEDLYVVVDRRGRGVAGRLIDAVVAWCAARRVTVLEVAVIAKSQRARDLVGFYRRGGFVDQGRQLLRRPVAGSP